MINMQNPDVLPMSELDRLVQLPDGTKEIIYSIALKKDNKIIIHGTPQYFLLMDKHSEDILRIVAAMLNIDFIAKEVKNQLETLDEVELFYLVTDINGSENPDSPFFLSWGTSLGDWSEKQLDDTLLEAVSNMQKNVSNNINNQINAHAESMELSPLDSCETIQLIYSYNCKLTYNDFVRPKENIHFHKNILKLLQQNNTLNDISSTIKSSIDSLSIKPNTNDMFITYVTTNGVQFEINEINAVPKK